MICWLLCLWLPLNLTVRAPAQSHDGKLWLVSVGISQFRDTRIGELAYASQDASDLAAIFAKQGQSMLLTDEKATLSRIMAIFAQLKQKVGAADMVVMFYSGHSDFYDNNTYLFSHDTISDNLADTSLAVNDLRQLLLSLPCRHVVVISDASRKSRLRKHSPAVEQIHKIALSSPADRRVAVLTATRTHEYGCEDAAQHHTIFAASLLQGLRGDADREAQDGQVSVAELFDYLVVQVPRNTERAQHPVAKYSAAWPRAETQRVMILAKQQDVTMPPLAVRQPANDKRTEKPTSDVKNDTSHLAKEINTNAKEMPEKSNTANDAGKGTYHALIIANAAYRDPTWTPLTTPLTNSKAIMSVLQDDYGFTHSHIRRLVNANRKQMLEALQNLAERVERNDRVFVCYFGHTYWDGENGQTYLVPVDARVGAFNRTLVPSRMLANSLCRLTQRARHVLAVFDSGLHFDCLGEEESEVEARPLPLKQKKTRIAKTCQVVMSACKEYKDDVYRQELSALGYFLVEGLKQNREAAYPASHIATFLQKRLRKAGEAPVKYVMLPLPEDKSEQFVFTRRAKKRQEQSQDDE
jgi:uncharacterized caspase-like protein